ncbi:MAG: putative Ig domain-containing protein [Christensenellaceae bacterium]
MYTDTLTITFQFGDAEGSAPSYTLTRQVTITIGQAPAAIISPDSVSVYKGQTETFQVVTSGSTPFTYSLSGEPTGVSIASDTGAMSINTTSLAVDEYSFTIHASGSYGDGATQSFTLHVIEPGSAVTPTITTHPASAFMPQAQLRRRWKLQQQ